MRNFKTQEVVSESTYKARGERSLQLIDKRMLTFLDELREVLDKPITVNNWLWGGGFHWRGLRTPESDVYSPYSSHSGGRAVDFDVKGMTANEVRQWIIEHRDLWWIKELSFIEDGVNWVHVDFRNLGSNDLWLWHVTTKETKVFKRG